MYARHQTRGYGQQRGNPYAGDRACDRGQQPGAYDGHRAVNPHYAAYQPAQQPAQYRARQHEPYKDANYRPAQQQQQRPVQRFDQRPAQKFDQRPAPRPAQRPREAPPIDVQNQRRAAQSPNPPRQRVPTRAPKAAPPRKEAPRPQIPIDPLANYRKIKTLSPGGMSDAITVYQHRATGVKVVQKLIKFSRSKENARRVWIEVRALKQCMWSAPSINRMMCCYPESRSEGNFYSIVLEFCEKGSLWDRIEAQQSKSSLFRRDFVAHVMIAVAGGLAFLHHGITDATAYNPRPGWDSIVHLDLKPCNIFLAAPRYKNGFPVVKIGDFGCAVFASDVVRGRESTKLPPAGTPAWYPPEGRKETIGAKNCRFGPETDIWDLGATIHAMCRRKFEPDRTEVETKSPCGSFYKDGLNRIVAAACHQDYRKRPKAHHIVRYVRSLGYR